MSEKEWLDIFADNLRDLMDEIGMSQKQLARDTGITQATISRYLSKKQMPSVKAIVNIVYALDCWFDELMDFGDMIE
jgi:transcriptional regulator with XRE-family HTH domain